MMETKYNIVTHTPLGDESFTISFNHHPVGIMTATNGSISGERGVVHFHNARVRDDNKSLIFSIQTDVPFSTELKFDAGFFNNEVEIHGRVVIGEYGYLEFAGERA